MTSCVYLWLVCKFQGTKWPFRSFQHFYAPSITMDDSPVMQIAQGVKKHSKKAFCLAFWQECGGGCVLVSRRSHGCRQGDTGNVGQHQSRSTGVLKIIQRLHQIGMAHTLHDLKLLGSAWVSKKKWKISLHRWLRLSIYPCKKNHFQQNQDTWRCLAQPPSTSGPMSLMATWVQNRFNHQTLTRSESTSSAHSISVLNHIVEKGHLSGWILM